MQPSSTTRKRSFTVRVDTQLYLEIAGIAQRENCDVNAVVTRLIKFGLGEHYDFEAALRQLLIQHIGVQTNGSS